MRLQGSSPDGVGAASYVSSPDGTLAGKPTQSVIRVGQPSSESGVVTLPSPVGLLAGRLDPSLEGLVSLPTYIVGGGGGGGDRPRIFHIDDFGADPTGVNESNQALINVYNALGGQPGVIVFGVGTYKFYVGLNEAAGRLLKPQQTVVGQGSGLTFIDYRGAGAFLEFRNKLDWATTNTRPAGGAHGMTILGWESGENNSYGIRYGDIWRMRITDVEINGFNRPGCIGLYGDNQLYWSERAYIECVVNQCTECFVFESNTGAQSFPTGSFDYSQYWLSFVAQPNQHAFVLRSGTPGSKATMNGVSITLTGNCQVAAPGGTNTGALFRVGKDNDDPAALTGELNIGVETSGVVGGVAHFDFMQGSGPFWEVQSRVSASGVINLIPFSGTNFQGGTATQRTFAFGGMLKGSPSLGSTGTVQTFQSLQLVSQARGGYFLDLTRELQSVYVTEATGGTWTLSYSGQTTSALPHNATPLQVETALNALPALAGNVQVYSAPARFVNTVQMDEVGYTVLFLGALGGVDVPLLVANGAGLTGASPSTTVLTKAPGSPNPTYVIYVEQGSIFLLEPPPGTYRLRLEVGGLTAMPSSGIFGGDSPFGVNQVDVWIKQPDTGGPALFEPPYFVPSASSSSNYGFQWFDGQDPILSTAPGAVDIIRLTSYNFTKWVGQHLTRLSTTNVPPPASSSSPGVPGQIAFDANYQYTCVAVNTWKRSPLSTW